MKYCIWILDEIIRNVVFVKTHGEAKAFHTWTQRQKNIKNRLNTWKWKKSLTSKNKIKSRRTHQRGNICNMYDRQSISTVTILRALTNQQWKRWTLQDKNGQRTATGN